MLYKNPLVISELDMHIKLCAKRIQVFWILFQTSRLGSPQLEATFDTVIEVFLFLDINGNGKLNKNDMVKALNDASPREKSPSRITQTRFGINYLLLGFCFVSIFTSPLSISCSS